MLVVPVVLQAQITTGTLRGFITDAEGEALPGVTVEISSTSLMTPRTNVTDSRGAYRFLYLPGGRYDIKATLDGFGTQNMNNVAVQVSSTATANIVLTQAGLEETVTVEAETPVIDTESSSLISSCGQSSKLRPCIGDRVAHPSLRRTRVRHGFNRREGL